VTQPPLIPPSVTVKAGHVQPLWAGHPWVFRQALGTVDDQVNSGDEVLVIDPHGKVLGRGLYSAKSAIAVRLFTFEGSRPIDEALLRQRIEQAVALRRAHGLPDVTPGSETTGARLIHGEGDGLPGLVVDVFGDVLVAQLGTAGLKRLEGVVADALTDIVGAKAIIDRTPPNIAKLEGFEPREGDPPLLRGEAPEKLCFHERGLRYELPLALGQKTGFYFDQRPLRDRIEQLSRGSRVLDAFCYVGATGMAAKRGGASEVWAVDTSAPAIEAAKAQAAINELEIRFEQIDANKAFKQAADEGGWDVVICDPPKMQRKRHQGNKGGRGHKGRGHKAPSDGYRRLAAAATAAVKPGGLLAFCSCTGRVTMEQLQLQLALGARDANRRAVVVDRCFQGPDHPVVAAFPEGLYLKVLIARIEEL
jgi:23S rRNA (cytosine1962-C5)-methyltransferase